MSAELTAYFERLRSTLCLSPDVEDGVLRELRAHAEDRLAELRASGLSDEQAQRALLRRLDRPQVLARMFRQAYMAPARSDAIIASCAFLLAGALYATHLWSNPVAVAAVASVVVAVTLFGLWQGRPTWFYAWAGLALTLLSFCGYFAFVMLERGAALVSSGDARVLDLVGLAGGALYFPVALVVLGSCVLVASRRDWLDASLMLSPSAPVIAWLIVLHQNGGLREGASLAGSDGALAAAFLSMALAAWVFVRAQTRGAKLATICATSCAVLFATSLVFEPGLSPGYVLGRAILVLVFLLSPALLEAALLQPLFRSAGADRLD